MADITPNVVISMPSQLFTLARSFKAVANGKIYAGIIDTDPTIPANQIQVYLENEDGTHVPVSQPIIINAAGYPVYGGQTAKFVTVKGHSMAVYDAFNVQQFYYPNVLKYDPDQLRADLSTDGGAALIGSESGLTVQGELDALHGSIDGLSGSGGFSKIGRCPTIAELRSLEPTVNGRIVSVVEHTAGKSLGGGMFQYDEADVTSPDDNGWFIVTAGGKRYRRLTENNGEINLADFGLFPAGTLDSPITNAWNTAVRLGVTKIKIPRNKPTEAYVLNGGLTFSIPVAGIVISGDCDTYQGVSISHTGNNTGLTFQKSADSNLFSRVRIEFLRVLGNAGAAANFAEFQDTWRCGATSCWGSLYTLGAMFVLHNRTQWTENAFFTDIMSRSNKYGIMVKRTASSGGTDSFYGLQVQMHHQFAVANSSALAMPTLSDATNACTIYSAKLDIAGWYEAQGGHQAVLIGDYQHMLDSDVLVRTDGTGGVTTGTDMRAVNASGVNSRCDIYLRCIYQQGQYTDVSSIATGSSLGGFAQSLNAVNISTAANGRSIARARGARYKWQLSTALDKSFTLTNLPCYSSFRAVLSTKGTNMETSHTYIINTHGFNNLAEVVPINTYAGTGWDKFRLKPFGGGTGGSFSSGNGGKVTWDHLAAAFGQSVDATLEIEML